jgi:hypothetical protein
LRYRCRYPDKLRRAFLTVGADRRGQLGISGDDRRPGRGQVAQRGGVAVRVVPLSLRRPSVAGEVSVSEWVSQRSALGVEDRGGPEMDSSAVDGEIPALVVDLLVVQGAQQATIADRGDTALGPVALCPGRGPPLPRWAARRDRAVLLCRMDAQTARPSAWRDAAYASPYAAWIPTMPPSQGVVLPNTLLKGFSSAAYGDA